MKDPTASDERSGQAVEDGSVAPEADPVRPGAPAASLADLQVTRWDVACVGPIIGASIYALVGQPITPALLGTHPVLAALLRGSVPSMLLCGALAHGGGVPLWQAILAPLFALSWVDPFYYWAGRRYGRAIFDYYGGQSERMRRRIARGEAWFARYGFWGILFAAYIPVSVVFFVAAGESRMKFWKFLAADVMGNIIWISTVVALGYALGRERGQSVADAISHYALWLTLGSIAIVAVLVFRQVRSSRSAAGEPSDDGPTP